MKAPRYKRIREEIFEICAKRILEVGTWSGYQAIEMLDAAITVSNEAFYYGFDLFEGMTEEISKEEFNVKAPFAKSVVEQVIKTWVGNKTNVYFSLFSGDTKETLPQFRSMFDGKIDLAWIDGGHSVSTIESDWKNCYSVMRSGGRILLDDYYSEVPDLDTEEFGCNKLVFHLQKEGFDVDIFPEKDFVKGGGFVQIARVKVK